MTRQEQEIVQAIKDGFNTTGEIKEGSNFVSLLL
jgi:hypothetical protein